MSKIGKMPVVLPEGVLVTVEKEKITVTGPKGSLHAVLPQGISIDVVQGKAIVSQNKHAGSQGSVLMGLMRAILANMTKGVSTGFEKKLELSGVGYRASLSGTNLMLSVGFSHQVKIDAPEGITYTINENIITVSGIDKKLVGDLAAKVRLIRPPEPYKGKGIKYVGEVIRRKAGKAAKVVGGVK